MHNTYFFNKCAISFISIFTSPRLAEKYRESGRQSSLTPNKRTASDSKRSTPLSPRSEQVSRIDDTPDPAVRARKVTFNNYIMRAVFFFHLPMNRKVKYRQVWATKWFYNHSPTDRTLGERTFSSEIWKEAVGSSARPDRGIVTLFGSYKRPERIALPSQQNPSRCLHGLSSTRW